MAHNTLGVESTLRAYLLADAAEFRKLMTKTLLDHSAESAEFAWTETSKSVDALAAGKACRIHRYQLPDDHPARVLGEMCDSLLLGDDDVLRPAAPQSASLQLMMPAMRSLK